MIQSSAAAGLTSLRGQRAVVRASFGPASSCRRRHPSASQQARRTISSQHLTIERTQDDTHFQNRPRKEDLSFGQTMSDHMLQVEWSSENGGGWGAPRIVPYQDLRISPAASCLHYGEW